MALIALIALPASAAASGLPAATLSFHSVPALHPPQVQVSSDPDRGSGDIFLTPSHSYQSGPMILDPQGQLVWFQPVYGWVANLEVQHYLGRPVLTWWQGRTPTSGPEDVVLNSAYQVVAVIRGANGYAPDLHEFQITAQGTALIDEVRTVTGNLTKYGGSAHGSVQDDVIQERDLHTGQVLWEWHSLGHVPVSDSYLKKPSSGPYDYFHLNSIQQLPGDNLLICARDTWTVYDIDERTGKLAWELGGRHSSFQMGPGTRFEWQHDAHLQGRILTVFDDASDGSGQESRQSSAKVLRMDFKARTARLVKRYTHTPPLLSTSQGSTQLLPGGNVFVGWGGQPDFSEYTASGRQLFTGSLPIQMNSYRAYRYHWSAQPQTKPSLALAARPGGVRVYASWNGATSVSDWRVLGGSSVQNLQGLDRSRRTGFETEIDIASRPRFVAVEALAGSGAVLGMSPVRPDPANPPG